MQLGVNASEKSFTELLVPFPEGSTALIDAAKRKGETRVDFVRRAIQREIEREMKARLKAQK